MRTLNDYFLTSAIPDVSSSSSTFVNVPDGGRIIKIFAHNKATTTGTAASELLEDGTIEMLTDGASTGAKKLVVTFVIRR